MSLLPLSFYIYLCLFIFLSILVLLSLKTWPALSPGRCLGYSLLPTLFTTATSHASSLFTMLLVNHPSKEEEVGTMSDHSPIHHRKLTHEKEFATPTDLSEWEKRTKGKISTPVPSSTGRGFFFLSQWPRQILDQCYRKREPRRSQWMFYMLALHYWWAFYKCHIEIHTPLTRISLAVIH